MKIGIGIIAAALAAATAVWADDGPADGGGAKTFERLKLAGEWVRWDRGPDQRAPVVTYAYVPAPVDFPAARNCRSMEPIDPLLANSGIARPAFESEVRAAFDMWSAAADIEFVETKHVETAGIWIGAQRIPEGRAFADVTYRDTLGAYNEIERSLICLNPQRKWKIGFDGDLSVYDLRYTIAHEIGHAIGLDHPSPRDQLMSHRYQEAFRTLQPGDVSGAVEIYGARERRAASVDATGEGTAAR